MDHMKAFLGPSYRLLDPTLEAGAGGATAPASETPPASESTAAPADDGDELSDASWGKLDREKRSAIRDWALYGQQAYQKEQAAKNKPAEPVKSDKPADPIADLRNEVGELRKWRDEQKQREESMDRLRRFEAERDGALSKHAISEEALKEIILEAATGLHFRTGKPVGQCVDDAVKKMDPWLKKATGENSETQPLDPYAMNKAKAAQATRGAAAGGRAVSGTQKPYGATDLNSGKIASDVKRKLGIED